MDIRNIGQRISQLRKQSNMSQKELAEKLNISNKTISKWECGNGMPDIESLGRLANVFGITLDELVNPKTECVLTNETECVQQEPSPTRIIKRKSKRWMIFLVAVCVVVLTVSILLCYFLIPRTPKILQSTVFMVDEDRAKAYCVVDNETEQFSFSDVIEVPLTNDWDVYYDMAGTQIIRSKTVKLTEGDNIFYIIVENNSGDKKTYTITVRRKPIYTVVFNTDGGEPIADERVVEGELASYQEAVRVGYIFYGWNYDFAKPIMKDTTINAIWVAKNITVLYYANNGTDITSAQEITYDSTVSLKTAQTFEKTGYTLSAWNTKEDGSGIAYEMGQTFENFTLSSTDFSLYAQWKINKYSMSVTKNITKAGIVNGTGMFEYGSKQTLTAITNTGYVWQGWYTKEDTFITDSQTLSVTIGTNGVEYIAKWEAKEYTLTLDSNGGTQQIEPTDPIRYDNEYTLPVPKKTRYRFVGWYILINGQEALLTDADGRSLSVWKIDENATLYAKWEAEKYAITYDLAGGTNAMANPSYYAFDDGEITLQAPTKKGYVFIGWSGTDLVEKTMEVTIPANSHGERSYTAHWDAKTNILRFESGLMNSSGSMADIKAKTGEVIILPKNEFSYLSYVFLGWRAFDGNDVEYLDGAEYVMGAEDVNILCAVWKEPDIVYDAGVRYVPSEDGSYYIVDDYVGTEYEVAIVGEYDGIPVKEIASSAFEHKQIRTITLPNTITYIGYRAFAECYDLQEIVLPDNLEYVMDQAFFRCSNLQTAVVPDDINYFAVHVFELCNQLTITCKATEKPVGWVDGWNCNRPVVWAEKASLKYTYELLGGNAVITGYVGNDKAIEIPSAVDVYEVVGISAHAFENNPNLYSVVIPNSVKTIGEYAFSGCINLWDIRLGEVENIGEYAFGGCAIETIDIPATVISVGKNVFNNNAKEIAVYCQATQKPNGFDENWTANATCEVRWGELLQTVYDAFAVMDIPYTFTDGITFNEPVGVAVVVKYKADSASDYSSVVAEEGRYSITTQLGVDRYEIVVTVNGVNRNYTIVKGTVWADFDNDVLDREYVLATSYIASGVPAIYENDGLQARVYGYTGGFLAPNLDSMWLYVNQKSASDYQSFNAVNGGVVPKKMGVWLYAREDFILGSKHIWSPNFGYATADIEIKAGYHFYELSLPDGWSSSSPVIGFYASSIEQYYIDAIVLM